MRPESLIVGTGNLERYDVKGNYIRLKTGVVPITFKTHNDDEVTLEQGGSTTLEPFDYLLIEHNDAADQNIEFYIGRDDEKITEQKFSGSAQVTGGSDNTASPPKILEVVNPPTPQTLVTPWAIYLGTALQTIVTPGANTAGIRIDNISMGSWGAAGVARVMRKSSAPSAYTDGYGLSVGYTNSYVDKVKMPIIIPAGQGLYAQGNIANIAYVSIDYEVLP